MIDVIIPAYNAHEFIGLTLSSIAFQDCVDMLNVYIVDDCSKNDYNDFVKYYSNFMNIKELKLKNNSGPGCARQFGIDNSNSEYLLFIDSDDVLTDNYAIRRLYNALVDTDSDISVGGFYEEKDFGFMFHDVSYVWMHAKMYKRKFLIKNQIRFNESRANEDCGFNHLCYLCGASYVEVPGVSYIWRNNTSSITRVNNGETFRKNIKSFTYNMMWSLSEALKRNFHIDRFSDIVYGTIVSCYHYYLQDEIVFEEDNIFEQIFPLISYYEKYSITDNEKITIIRNQIMADASGPDLIKVYDPRITLTEFISLLKSKGSDVR